MKMRINKFFKIHFYDGSLSDFIATIKYFFAKWLCNQAVKIIGRACVTRIVTKEGHDLSGLKLVETSNKDWHFPE